MNLRLSVRGFMLAVVAALLPGLALHAWQLGPLVILQTAWCVLFALLVEALCLKLRGLPLARGLADCSWLLTGCLMGRALPLLVPVWLMLLATIVALGVVKHASGGLGRNRLNPVMAGLGVVAVCFYQLLTPTPDFSAPWSQQLDFAASLALQLQLTPAPLDVWSGATALSAGLLSQGEPLLAWVGYLLGGLVLALLRIIRIEIPLAMVGSSLLLCLATGHTLAESLTSLTLGGYLFAAFFIATDPVTSPDSTAGRVLFGVVIGLVTELVREFGLYADGLCFAVLAGNLLVPHINRLVRCPVLLPARTPLL